MYGLGLGLDSVAMPSRMMRGEIGDKTGETVALSSSSVRTGLHSRDAEAPGAELFKRGPAT